MRPLGRLDPAADRSGTSAPADLAPRAEAPASPPPRRAASRVMAGAVVVALALAVTALLAYRWGSASSPQAAPAASPRPSATAALSPAEIYDALAPSVVTVEVTRPGARGGATGTGVVANGAGMVVTALHVVKDAAAIQVRFADGTPSAAMLLGADPANDIAALGVASLPTVVVPATFGNSGRMSVGDSIFAIGNQLGLAGSATAGIVSGLNRAANGVDGTSLRGLIQFDAAVNPGSSGGPLVNDKGETVGIVVALANPTDADTFIGVGFAVPIGTALAAGGDGRGPQQ
ncbi:MAG TPA: trypsin-like peptidase domain-containing protein [Micromonosporaceae bacterium]|nr:trypsin-like peptidase domain-containing protein [Micromonosporaceae bacterium]